MYTDDPVFIVVGVQRALRALRLWRRLTDEMGLVMAIAEKRSLGSWTLWIGVLLIPALGIVVVPRSKLLRAAGPSMPCSRAGSSSTSTDRCVACWSTSAR